MCEAQADQGKNKERLICAQSVVQAVSELCQTSCCLLPGDVFEALQNAHKSETSPLGVSILGKLLDNAWIARQDEVPICQDTGVAVFFVEIGTQLCLEGLDLEQAIALGVEEGYRQGFLRMSIVDDPLFSRCNTHNNCPPVIHYSLVPGDKLRITLLPKGGGSENKSRIAMLNPLVGKEGVKNFVLETIKMAGADSCPPLVVGIGIGGTFEKAPLMAKRSLLRPLGEHHADPRYAQLEAELLSCINATGIGPQGLGGKSTALAVHIETAPCHIASLPVAINLNCHALRHATIELP